MAELRQRRIVLGVTGGIAAYKAAELARLFVKDGVDVQVVMTQAACGFVTPATFQALTGKPVFTDLWDGRSADGMAHISLTRGVDAIVVAPATADFIAKLAHGFADDLLSTLCLARPRAGCPLLVAPAMNREMWEAAPTQRNVAQLAKDGVVVAGPARGVQACGETGEGRMLEANEIHEATGALLAPKLLPGTRMLITAGPTFEALDPVRGITNRSSGKMGFALARAALDAGARVTLIAGPVQVSPPTGAEVVRVESAAEMFAAVKKHAKSADIFVGVAAVADYRPEKVSTQKIKKTGDDMPLRLVPNPDILAWVAGQPRPPFTVGFAAESQKLNEFADAKRRSKKVQLMVANLAQHAIGADDNEVTLLDDGGLHKLPRAPKSAVAQAIVAHIAVLYRARRKTKK